MKWSLYWLKSTGQCYCLANDANVWALRANANDYPLIMFAYSLSYA